MQLPTTTQARQVRMLIGDTNGTLVTDQQLGETWDLAGGRLFDTAALLCDGLAAKYAQSVTFSVEGLSIQNSVKVENYRKLAQSLRARGGDAPGALGIPFVGGVSISARQAVEADTDRPPSHAVIDGDGNHPTNPLVSDQR